MIELFVFVLSEMLEEFTRTLLRNSLSPQLKIAHSIIKPYTVWDGGGGGGAFDARSSNLSDNLVMW